MIKIAHNLFSMIFIATVKLRKENQVKKTKTVCYYHVTYAFQSESTLCIYLNVKEFLARNRRGI